MTKKIRIRVSFFLPDENKNDFIQEAVEKLMAHVGCNADSVYCYRQKRAPGSDLTTTIPIPFYDKAKAFGDYHGRNFTELVNEALAWKEMMEDEN